MRDNKLPTVFNLNWDALKILLKVVLVARHAVDVIVDNCYGTASIKKKVGVVYNNTKSSLYKIIIHMKPLIATIMIVVTLLTTWDKQSTIVAICLVLVVDNLLQGEVIIYVVAMMKSVRA